MTAQQKQQSDNPRPAVLTIRAGVIRDGTPGISISLDGRLVGEWTDSRAKSLRLGNDLKVLVLDSSGEPLYNFVVPGKPLSARTVSDREVAVTFDL